MIDTIQSPHLTFDEATHQYFWDGESRPGVSHILGSVGSANEKGELVPIADNRWCKDETAANFGKAFHKAVLYDFLGVIAAIPEQLIPWYKQFKLWRKQYNWAHPRLDSNGDNLGAFMLEYPMYHELLGYCGTSDLIAEPGNDAPAKFRNSILVVDWKTSTQKQDHWKYQTAAYGGLYKHVFKSNKKICTMSVRFDEDTFRVYSRTGSDVTKDWNFFVSALNIFKG